MWALIVVLGYSRHSFVWPTFSQKLEDVIAGLEAAWAFFGGIPTYLVREFLAERTGASWAMAEACLAYASGNQTEQSYHRTTYFEQRRELMEVWGRFLSDETDGLQGRETVGYSGS